MTVLSIRKFFLTNFLPSLPIDNLIFLFFINFFIAINKSSESFGFISIPFVPSTTTSLHPVTLVVIIGFPQAAASNKPFGNPSLYEGRTTI